MLCLITDIKTRLGIGAENDAILTAIVAGVTGLIESFCNRKLILPSANVTECLSGGCEFIQLRYYPIVSITTLKETFGDFDFTNATALVANTDYRIVGGGEHGIIQRMYTNWPDGLDAVQAVYKGGYVAAGTTPGTGETAVPADLKELAILQCCHLFKRRDDIGLSSVSAMGGSVNVFSELNLLPIVKDGLRAGGYMRIAI
jgi:hypothetical protein